jgi:Lipid A 3-O-deacylase (PagL)
MMRVVLTFLLVAGLAQPGFAEDPEPGGVAGWLSAPDSYAFRVMNGHAHSRSVETIAFGPRATFDVLGFLPEIFGHRVRLGVELLGMVHDKLGTKHEINFNPLLLDWRHDTGGRFAPYVEAGEGGLWTTLRHLSLGGKFQFASHLGVGAHVFWQPELAVSFGYRFRHISNAGLNGSGGENELNHGLNQHFFIIGVTRFPGRGSGG